MPDDRVFAGIIQNLRGRPIPFWVANPRQSHYSAQRIYINLPNLNGAIAMIKPLERGINLNDKISEFHKCFISVGRNTFLSAVLRRYYPDERLPGTNKPRAYVRMPDGNNTLYVGEIDYDFGCRPSWLE